MTRIYDQTGKATAVTVIEAGGNTQLQLKTLENDGYNAVQVGFDTQKPQRVNKAMAGHFAKGESDPKRLVREFRLTEEEAAGEIDLKVTRFVQGQFVDVIGKSKGKGFQGVMKRHHFKGQEAAHGSKTHRRNGSIGPGSTPGRIWKNVGMPGHMGHERITVQNLQVVQIREEDNVLLISGAVPGPNGSYVVIRPAKKRPNLPEAK